MKFSCFSAALVISVVVSARAAGGCCCVPCAEEQVFSETPSVLFLDILSSTVIKKPRFSSWETSHLSSDTQAGNHVDSLEKKEETKTGNVRLVLKVKRFFCDGTDHHHVEAFRER